jgi:hypothetical protein
MRGEKRALEMVYQCIGEKVIIIIVIVVVVAVVVFVAGARTDGRKELLN